MSRDFRRGPPTRYEAGGEAEAFELVRWARAYGDEHPAVFGGAWCDYVEHEPYAFARFTDDLAAHRAALDPRIRLVPGALSAASLHRIRDEVAAMMEDDPAVVSGSADVDEEREHVLVVAETSAEDAFTQAVRQRFVTAWSTSLLGFERAPGADGPRINWGSTLEGYDREASVTLSRPLGGRRVLDDQRDRIDDHPPVRRPAGVDMPFDLFDFVDALDWAELQGTSGPGANGWVRVFATVDDTERLRAALDERFGGGFEVVWKRRWQDSVDEDE